MAGKTPSEPSEWAATLAHHDAAIANLGGRMHGVETGLRTLQGEVHSGFNLLGSKLDKLDAQPKFDFHKTVSTVTTIAVLFSMMVGGIIWVTTNQFSGVVAEQKGINTAISKAIEKHDYRLDRHETRISKNEEEIGRWQTYAHRARGSK